MDSAKGALGDDIWEKVDVYFALKGDTPESKEEAEKYLRDHPEVETVLNWKAEAVLRTPLLSSYYGGIDKIESYWKGVMWEELGNEFGDDIWDKWDQYYLLDGDARREYYRAHPELGAYTDARNKWYDIINEHIISFGSRLQEGLPAEARDVVPQTQAQEAALSVLGQEPQGIPVETWRKVIVNYGGSSLWNLIVDDEPLPEVARLMLDELAGDLGIMGGADTILEQLR